MTNLIKYANIPYAPKYKVGSDGSIWTSNRFKDGRWIRIKGDPRKEDGRLRASIRLPDGSICRRYISTFVLEAFVGPRPIGMECCHNDSNCLNDHLYNLRWDTPENNVKDKLIAKRHQFGETMTISKLTSKEVLEIREKHSNGMRLIDLAEAYKVTASNINCIVKHKTWKHLDAITN